MKVVSGALGKEKVHFEAPSAERVSHEMTLFLDWLNNESGIDLVLKSIIAHFWDKHKLTNINDRQRLVINYLYDNYDRGTGFLRTSTYAKLSKISNDTALRDLQDLVAKEILKSEDSVKKTNYVIISPKGIRIPKISET
ncbi:MAG: hypothetical protein ACK5IQ_08800 [Bacteroidales bacterium]